uniref:Liver-expressed antimicrobial peptide 2 n=1 Tax=Apteryx owenii TaxID=8824 RepID=A0A8B9SCX6_APTOW
MTAPVPLVPGVGRGGAASRPLSGPRRAGIRLALLLSILLLLTSSVQVARRLARMTPFWRTVGSKPLGAHCRHGLECITKSDPAMLGLPNRSP